MRTAFRILPFLLLAIASPAGAQYEFAEIPWNTAPEAAAERIRAAGYAFVGVDQEGDWVFRGANGGELVAAMSPTGLVEVVVTWRLPSNLERRYAALSDSLRRAMGAPDDEQRADEEGETIRSVTWMRDLAELSAVYFPRQAGLDSAVTLNHRGPESEPEYMRRDSVWQVQRDAERVSGPSDTTGIGDWAQVYGGFRRLVRVDSVRYARVDASTYSARLLDNWTQQRRRADGLKYDGAVSEVQLDCGRFRSRVQRRILMNDYRALPEEPVPAADAAWATPRPQSPDGIAIRGACEVLGKMESIK